MVCVPADRDANPVRQFAANTRPIFRRSPWLKKCGVNDRFGIHRDLLGSPFRAARIQGLRGLPGRTGTAALRRQSPRRTCSMRSGSSGCTPTAPCVGRSGLRIPCAGATCLLAAAADGALRRQPRPTRPEGPGADERQTDGSHKRHRGGDRLDHRRHPEGRAAIPSNWPNWWIWGLSSQRGGDYTLRWKAERVALRASSSRCGRQRKELYRFHHRQQDHRVRPGDRSRTGEVREPGGEKKLDR